MGRAKSSGKHTFTEEDGKRFAERDSCVRENESEKVRKRGWARGKRKQKPNKRREANNKA